MRLNAYLHLRHGEFHAPHAAIRYFQSGPFPRGQRQSYPQRYDERQRPFRHLTDLEKPWRRIRKEAGLEDVRIHDLRHSLASDALELGEGLTMIGKLSGHRDLESPARYAHRKKEPRSTVLSGTDEAMILAFRRHSLLSLDDCL